jgi:hypothetical protein
MRLSSLRKVGYRRRSAGEEGPTPDKDRMTASPLATARGIVIAIGVGLVLWAVIGIGLWYLLDR